MKNLKESVENILKDNLKDFELSKSFGHRSVGDKIESDCADIIRNNFPKNYFAPRSKKSTEDFALIFDKDITYFDVKTHFLQEDPGFSMPNLISVKVLKKLLKSEKSLIYIFVDYERVGDIVVIGKIIVKYIYELDWSILGIGALGKGQLQIKNANNELIFTQIGKEKWFEILKKNVVIFYEKELKKIAKDITMWV